MGLLGALFSGTPWRAPATGAPALAENCSSNLERAVYGLALQRPEFSARIVATRAQISLFLISILVMLALMAQWPRQMADAIVWMMSVGFLIGVLTRCTLVLLGRARSPAVPIANDLDWPIYSILVPLYREAQILPQLAEALSALDYPPEKRDIHWCWKRTITKRGLQRSSFPTPA